MSAAPILVASGITKRFGTRVACDAVCFELFPGEVMAIVGESGSGKSTLLNCLAARLVPDAGKVEYRTAHDGVVDVHRQSVARQRMLARTEWGFVQQRAVDGLRANVSAGANIGERLMATGARHYGQIRTEARAWFERIEMDPARLDDLPREFSGGMQQRLQIARNLVTRPRLVFMDEPTSGLDVSVQARLLDLLRGLTRELELAALVVTHDLAVARLLAERMLVMRGGAVVEAGLTDQVLEDPQHPYTQLLVASAP